MKNLLFVGLFTCICFLTATALQWHNITDPYEHGALCNDFTPAGYFIRLNPNSTSWLIFLEGGGGCRTIKQCNERYIDYRIRRLFKDGNDVNASAAWNAYKDQDKLAVTSKLMTSLWRFNDGNLSGEWEIEGTDMLSCNAEDNPLFSEYNHVLIPYCSSDSWLGSTKNYDKFVENDKQFIYDPLAVDNQFTFRGIAIFRRVVIDLLELHGLDLATDVFLAGSSAGGIGALNHAQWLRDALGVGSVKLSVIADSSWFVNFKETIKRQFDEQEINISISEDNSELACSSLDPSYCISAEAILSHDFPSDVPVMVIFSLYDLYLLGAFLANTSTDIGVVSLMRVVSEYSGSMINSLYSASSHHHLLSYYVTSCFQHVYFANSVLWGPNALLGEETIDEELENNRFKHTIRQNVWTTFKLTCSGGDPTCYSMSEALDRWLQLRDTNLTVHYLDSCEGPHCNPVCPETILLGELTPYWSISAQSIVVGLVVLVVGVSIVIKIVLDFHFMKMVRTQKTVIEEFAVNPYKGLDSDSGLPACDEREAVSIACLDLRYSVSLSKSALKNAANDFDGGHRYKRLLSISASTVNERRRIIQPIEDTYPHDVEIGRDCNSISLEDDIQDLSSTIRQFQQNCGKPKSTPKKKRQGYPSKAKKMKKGESSRKQIIRGISAYFNPGELVAVMGPSGCGKTTFTDLLAGRRNIKPQEGSIYVNGTTFNKLHSWYIARTGYVLQLATPYYHTLTVRENITLAAQMRLPKTLSLQEKLERVEQILEETGLTNLANTVVGTDIGPGLSGGQKKRLCVALQLISLPSLLFMDEPTSGLDATSSLELLTYLNKLASSNRTVILTIHQPRLEIFHMFTKIILLCHGQVAYHGVPEKVYQFFVDAHTNASLDIKKFTQSSNPADVVMDMLGSEESSLAILEYYNDTNENEMVIKAIEEATLLRSPSELSNATNSSSTIIGAGFFNRISALEARAKRHFKLSQALYLPVIFTLYGMLLGTVYFQSQNSTFILSAFGVFSCAPGLFLFPIMHHHLHPALQLFYLEYSDGIGQPLDLILQTFFRFSSLTVIPVLMGILALYFLVIPFTQYDFCTFLLTTVLNLVLTQTWITIVIFLITTIPNLAHRISPVLSAVAGFASGFFIPPGLMPEWYSWLFYINPNYYGFSSVARLVLEDITLDCQYQSPIECYPSTGKYLLTYFTLHEVNPFFNISMLMLMSLCFLLLSWFTLSFRLNYSFEKLQNLFKPQRSTSSGFNHPDNMAKGFQGPKRSSLSISDACNSTQSSASHLSRDPIRVGLSRQSSSMLTRAADSHEVWRPGRRISRNRYLSDSISARKMSFYRSIKSVQEQEVTDGNGNKADKNSFSIPNNLLLERRRNQWRQISIDASNDEQNRSSIVIRQLNHSYTDSNIIPVSSESSFDVDTSRASTLPNSTSRHRPESAVINNAEDINYHGGTGMCSFDKKLSLTSCQCPPSITMHSIEEEESRKELEPNEKDLDASESMRQLSEFSILTFNEIETNV